MPYQLEYRTADGKLIDVQVWRPHPGRPEHPLIGDLLELVHSTWKVIEYVLMSVLHTGIVIVESQARPSSC